MSLAGQRTTSIYLPWENATLLVLKLYRDGEFRFSLLICVGIYMGLRIKDILGLTWLDILDKDQVEIIESKTKKHRTISIHPELKEHITRCHADMKVKDPTQLIFLNRYNTKSITVQYINRRLKKIMGKYKVVPDGKGVSTHLFRKTMGRRIYEVNAGSERSLVLLSEIMNHSSLNITRRYLGITQSELNDVYMSL